MPKIMSDRRGRLGSLMLKPYRVAAIFPLAAAGAILTSLPFSHWTHRSFVTLLILAAIALSASSTRFVLGNRPPAWSLHLDVLFGLVFVSVLNSIQPRADVNFAVLYIWIAVFAALYFRPLFAVLHLGGVGAAYAVVLVLSPGIANPATTWMAIFGSAAVLSVVTIGLVNVLRSTSREDVLTGLANRRAWDDRLDEELERARRNNTSLSLAMIDVDNFKAVNDRGGHPAGDRLLCEFADGWRGVIREGGDFLARLSGDEFGVMAPNINELGIQCLAQRLQEITPGGVFCSVGVATWDGIESATELFRRADEAMYRAKRERRAA
jgi:diguanylate cyclase (GGDEF)-like protein